MTSARIPRATRISLPAAQPEVRAPSSTCTWTPHSSFISPSRSFAGSASTVLSVSTFFFRRLLYLREWLFRACGSSQAQWQAEVLHTVVDGRPACALKRPPEEENRRLKGPFKDTQAPKPSSETRPPGSTPPVEMLDLPSPSFLRRQDGEGTLSSGVSSYARGPDSVSRVLPHHRIPRNANLCPLLLL